MKHMVLVEIEDMERLIGKVEILTAFVSPEYEEAAQIILRDYKRLLKYEVRQIVKET